MTRYLSDSRPDFSPFEIDCGKLQAYRYQGSLADELARGRLNAEGARQLLEDMLTIRELEEMIVKLRSGAYSPLAGYNYRGPTHVSIGQEGTSAGASSALSLGDLITTTHRGHGDSLARGSVALRALSEEQLRARLPGSRASCRCERIEEALDDHVFRTIAELFGKEDGYCRGRGGSMHIADFSLGHLGANAIVGGNVPIATGAALALRYLRREGVVCCFAGDGAFSNGVVLESLNFAAQAQFSNELAGELRFGMPIIFLVVNNQYGMTHRTAMEVTGVRHLARRAAGFAENNLHAELVNGMDALAVRDAVLRAAEGCRQGLGPYFIEASTYRYYGHSLSDPRNEYRTKEEEVAWKEADPIASLERQILDAQILNPEGLRALQDKVRERNRRAAERAVASPDPDPAEVTKYLYTTTCSESVPQEFRQARYREPSPARRASTSISYRDAIREAMFEEMARDARVIFYGEDVADYGGAFKLTRGLLETFGRERVFNTPISEAAICGTAVGAAMAGLRPVVELMYMDFVLMASDQICNQAAKWHYMSGAQIEVPLVLRVSVGGGKGYGGQHSQTLESLFTHIPGARVVYPATPYDAKGLFKSSVRDNNPVVFLESQLLYGVTGEAPPEDYLVPLGVADIKRAGKDLTLVAWGPAVPDALKAAERLQSEGGASVEVIDLRSLAPLDLDTILESVRKTGRCVIASHCIRTGSFMSEIAASIQERLFGFLDAPILRVGAKDGIAPQSHILEAAFLPSCEDIVAAARSML